MPRRTHNPQMFALPSAPPERLDVAGAGYRLVSVFKHDFWAATCLYEPETEGSARIVVKLGRTQGFCGLPLAWVGERLADHEQAIYDALAGVKGTPRWVARLSPTSYAIEYLDARPLDHLESLPPRFFDRLRGLFDAIHARDVAYGDANKRSNILVTQDGEPALVDFQVSLRRRNDWPRPLRWIARRMVEYLAAKDLYHLYKHKRRMAPQELTAEEEALSRRRTGLHLLHRKLTKPYRALRRGFLRKQYAEGRLQSPTADLENHSQPEKATWRGSERPKNDPKNG